MQSGEVAPTATPAKISFADGKYNTPESPSDTFAYIHGSVGLNAPGTGTKVIQRCMTDLDDLISRRKKELSDIQHSGLKSSHKKKSGPELRSDIKPIPMAGLTSSPNRKFKETDADIKRDLHIVEEEESAFSETLEELLMHSESHNTTKTATTTVTHTHLHFDVGDGNGHNSGNPHNNKTAEEEELHELRHLYKTSQSKITLLEEKIVQMELHVEANMTGNSQRAKLQAEERTKLQAQRAQLEDELSSANEELQFLRVQLQSKSAKVLDLETELTQAQREVQDLRNKIDEDAEQMKRLGDASRSLFNDKVEIQCSYRPPKETSSSDDEVAKEPSSKKLQLKAQLASLHEEVASLQKELSLVKAEYESVIRDKNTADKDRATLQSKVKELEYSLTQADAKLFESEVAAAEAENKYEDLEKKSKERVEQLRKEIVALMKLNESLQGDVKALQKNNQDLAKEGHSNDEVIAELKKQHDHELNKAKAALSALNDKHAAQIADLKAQFDKEREQQLTDALTAMADCSDLNATVKSSGKGSAPPTPTPSSAAAAATAAPVKGGVVMEPVEIPAPTTQVVVKKPRSNTGFYLGLALVQAGIWSLLLLLAYVYINHVDVIAEFPIRLVPYRYTS